MSRIGKGNKVTVRRRLFNLNDELARLPEEARRALADRQAVTEVGLMIRRFRETKGLSQRALAEAIATTQSAISELESGAGNQGPTFAMLKRIIEACGLEIFIRAESKSGSALAPSPVVCEIVPGKAGLGGG